MKLYFRRDNDLGSEGPTSDETKVYRGSGIMVSDEQMGTCHLSLTQEEYDEAKKTNPTIRKYARQQLEYGESKEGYWTSEKFMVQLKQAVKIGNVQYPKDKGWRVVWIFDHSIAAM